MPQDPYTSSVFSPSQVEPLDERQVRNNAGGFVYEIPRLEQLKRFLILGSVGGTYYASEQKFTKESLETVRKVVMTDGMAALDLILDVSNNNRAPRHNPTLAALAIASIIGDDEVRSRANSAIKDVCRTSTHLFIFMNYRHAYSNHKVGRGLRRGLSSWYDGKSPESLALQAVKYRQREGWTHRDILRTAHPITSDPQKKAVFDFICNRENDDLKSIELIEGYNRAQKADIKDLPALIEEYRLPWEALPTEAHKDPAVWEALMPHMGMTALIRNLNRFTKLQIVNNHIDFISGKLSDESALLKGRIHPLFVLNAMMAYKESRTYNPDARIVDLLDEAFYLSFGSVHPSGQRISIGLDVSGSMGWGTIAGTALTPRVASAALCLVTARTESHYKISAFADTYRPMTISPRQRLDDVIRNTDNMPFGGTDCALPILEASKNKEVFDAFIVYTDSETWAGRTHPSQALDDYRHKMGVDAKLIVVGMVANHFSIADPNDSGMMDVVGFDMATPDLISTFIAG